MIASPVQIALATDANMYTSATDNAGKKVLTMPEYIEREALMKNFCGYDLTKCVKYGNENAEQQHDSYSTMMMYEIADEIEDAPAADVAPVRPGKWLKKHDSIMYWHECSECGERRPRNFYGYEWDSPFCPSCGARMDGGVDRAAD